jgi:hypothetical protein
MPFVHPAIFYGGLIAASIPVIIHLLNRRRYKIRPWAAMQFLLEAVKRNRQRLRLEELLLLLLRCLIALVLGCTLARFTGCENWRGGHAAGGPSVTVFVLDDSYSMGQKVANTTAFDQAKAELITRLGEMNDNASIEIVRTGDDIDGPFFAMNMVTDRDSLVRKIDGLTVRDRRANWPELLDRVAGAYGDRPGTKELVLLSDFREVDFEVLDSQTIAPALTLLTEGDVAISAMDFSQPAGRNAQIESLVLQDSSVVAEVGATFAITVANTGSEVIDKLPVSLTLVLPSPSAEVPIEVPLPQVTISSLAPGDRRTETFRVICPSAGSAAIRAELGPDELPGDNTAQLALTVRELMNVLVVDGRPNLMDPPASASFYFVAAADPSGRAADGVKVDVISANDLPGVVFADYDVVAMLNVPSMLGTLDEDGSLYYPQLEAMEAYVAEGGGVVFFLGERINPDFYNGPMHRDGAGLSPYRLGPQRGDETDWDGYVRLDPESVDQTSEAVGIFHGPGKVLMNLIRVFAYVPAEEVPLPATDLAGQPRVLVRLTDAESLPLMVSRQYGEGEVLWVYTTAGRRWSDWCDDQPRGLYVTPVQDMLRTLSRGQKDRAGVGLDEPIHTSLPPAFVDADVTLRRPDYPTSDLETLTINGESTEQTDRHYDHTDMAGIYAIQASRADGQVFQRLFARNNDPREGLLPQAGKRRLQALFGKERLTYRDSEDLESGTEELLAKGEEYWLWLMGTLIVLIALETVLAQRFGHYSE